MKKACLLIGLIFMVVLWSGCVESTGEATNESENITIGALLPLTGSVSSIGEASKVALEVSAEDLNNYYSEIGSGEHVEIVVKDTESNPEKALEKLKEFNEMGIKVIIGPQASSEAEAVLDYANKNGIILLSTASTAPSLAIPDDNLFRLAPDDTNQAVVLSMVMNDEGISTVVPMYTDDVWGNGLIKEVKKNFEASNGTVLEGIKYESNSTHLSAEVEALNEKVIKATSENSEKTVAVLLCSYGEAKQIFSLARNYPALSKVKWYGTDGIALNKELINDNNASSFAASIHLSAPIYGYTSDSEKCQVAEQEIKERLGRLPESYALTAYDALAIATFVNMEAISGNEEKVKMAMDANTETYHGISGWTILNENGDRKYWEYNIWTVTEGNGTYQWEKEKTVIKRNEELKYI